MKLQQYLKENLETVMEEMEEILQEFIPEVVQSYNWQGDDEEGFETSEYEWYDSYAHTIGYEAEYDAAYHWLKRHEFETSEENQETVLEKCNIKHCY